MSTTCFRPQRLLKAVLILLILIFWGLVVYRLLKNSGWFSPQTSDNFWLISAYYYPKSESLGENAVALVFVAWDRFQWRHREVKLMGINSEEAVIRSSSPEKVSPEWERSCILDAYFLTMQMVPNMNSLSIALGDGHFYQIPFETVSYRKRDVVVCISPLMANEQWQYLLFQVHIAKKYGSFLHVYVRSMIDPLFKLMLEYEKEGYLKMEPWLRMASDKNFNPNHDISFRAQEAAQTDCLLKYKESADFIAFFDQDEIVIPQLAGNYKEEFEYFFSNQQMTAYIFYLKRNAHLKTYFEPERFSLRHLTSSLAYQKETPKDEVGKTVARPRFLNHTWLHWPMRVTEGYLRYEVPIEQNMMTHMKRLHKEKEFIGYHFQATPYYNNLRQRPLLTTEVIKDIQNDFDRMKKKPDVSKIWMQLPQKFFYYEIIEKCYYELARKFVFRGEIEKITCTTPDRCGYPENPGIMCANARAENFSSTGGSRLNVYFSKNPTFIIEDGCVP